MLIVAENLGQVGEERLLTDSHYTACQNGTLRKQQTRRESYNVLFLRSVYRPSRAEQPRDCFGGARVNVRYFAQTTRRSSRRPLEHVSIVDQFPGFAV